MYIHDNVENLALKRLIAASFKDDEGIVFLLRLRFPAKVRYEHFLRKLFIRIKNSRKSFYRLFFDSEVARV